jgi:hypothetical protein
MMVSIWEYHLTIPRKKTYVRNREMLKKKKKKLAGLLKFLFSLLDIPSTLADYFQF